MISLAELEAGSSGKYEPFLSHMWRVAQMPAIGGQSLPVTFVEGVSLPFPTFTERSKAVASTEIYLANGTRTGEFTMQVGIDQFQSAWRYFTDWMNLVQNPYTGGFRLPSVYKKHVPVSLYDVTGKVMVTATVRNCWPTGFNLGELGGAPSIQLGQVQFKCEALIPNWSR